MYFLSLHLFKNQFKMKNLSKLFMLSIAVLIGSCTEQWDGTTWSVVAEPERTIGFVTGDNAEMQWHLGTQDAIDIVSTVDGLWATQDYEAMRPYFADSLVFTSYEGKTSNTFDDFVEAMTSGTSVSWTYDYSFSVDLDPSIGGEHVQAGFTVTYPPTDDSEGYVNQNHESYYIVDGKIISLIQYVAKNVSQE